jgi:hypothetical protein
MGASERETDMTNYNYLASYVLDMNRNTNGLSAYSQPQIDRTTMKTGDIESETYNNIKRVKYVFSTLDEAIEFFIQQFPDECVLTVREDGYLKLGLKHQEGVILFRKTTNGIFRNTNKKIIPEFPIWE